MSIILSHYQLEPLLSSRRANKTTAITSTDLGITTVQARLDADGIHFPSSEFLSWSNAEKVARDENACFVLRDSAMQKIQTFSEQINRPYSLYPTPGAPTMLVAGFPMHRIKDTDPWRAAVAMVKTLQPVTGETLDTATGLGYTAIELAKTARYVLTIELDPAAQEIARLNPWSQPLFNNPKIEQRIGDSFEIVPTFAANTFDAILHDPPTMSLAGDLYSLEFYRELYRVLKRGGKLFHYIGDPESKFGASVTRGVIERLKAAGFTRIKRAPHAFGVVAEK
ncbi:MAG TPA: methyltransferase domain-containing protein [Anaerolineae bacterium]|nr:methyltransferase domain-containing protein [Anaerolineae bacterium]